MEEMTRERLEAYRSNKEEIKELRYKLEHLEDGDNLVRNDVIFDYRKGYPRAEAIVGRDFELGEKRRTRYTRQIAKLETEQDSIEEWVFAIRNSQTRRIFQMYFLEGMNQEKVARKMHMAQSGVSRKIDEHLKCVINTHESS